MNGSKWPEYATDCKKLEISKKFFCTAQIRKAAFKAIDKRLTTPIVKDFLGLF